MRDRADYECDVIDLPHYHDVMVEKHCLFLRVLAAV